jgi:hypothetical protein
LPVEPIPTVNPENEPKLESPLAEPESGGNARRRGGRRSRNGRERTASEPVEAVMTSAEAPSASAPEPLGQPVDTAPAEKAESKPRRGGRRPRQADAAKETVSVNVPDVAVAVVDTKVESEAKPARAKRPARPRKPKAGTETPEN